MCCFHTQKAGGIYSIPPSTFPNRVCLVLGCNTTVSLLITFHASESFSNTSRDFGLVSLILGGVFSPIFFKLLVLEDLVHPGSTLPSREGFWEIETWVIRPCPSLRLHYDIQAVFRYSKRFKCRTFEWYLRHPRLQKTTAGSRIYNEDSFCTPNFKCHYRGVMI